MHSFLSILVLLLSFGYLVTVNVPSVALQYGAVGWFAVCECGNS